jgi:hypothetical protein
MIKKVISGGQKGVDRIGLEVAKELNIPTGGTAPKGYKTEDGDDLSLKQFGLVEDASEKYTSRTEKNVINSNATVIFGDVTSKGSKQTIKFLEKHNKKYIVNPTAAGLKRFIKENTVLILNVAGNRASKLKIEQIESITQVLREGLQYEK